LRRYDVVSAERDAAAANAKIGVAKAAFFPALNLSAQGGFDNSSLSQLLSTSSRIWTLGPSLAVSLFDGGARDAAVDSARAAYDGDAAMYRNTVITAFQSVEDSLSSLHHLDMQASAQARILKSSEQLYASAQEQRQVGSSSEQDLLGARLALLQAQRNHTDARAAFSESSVTLIKNLGGGWQWHMQEQSSP
jgi:outer membrane protein TolC